MIPKSVTDSAAFKKHKGIRLIVFNYLDAAALYHKIALLNKDTREMITRVGQLSQQKTLTLKSFPSHMSRLHYALLLADAIHIIIDKPHKIESLNRFGEFLDFKNKFTPERKTKVELTLIALNTDQADRISTMFGTTLEVRRATFDKSAQGQFFENATNIIGICDRNMEFRESEPNVITQILETYYEQNKCQVNHLSLPTKVTLEQCTEFVSFESPDALKLI